MCKGSLVLGVPTGVIVLQGYETRSVPGVNWAVLQGCGCYRLFNRKNFRGRSYLADKEGLHTVDFNRIKSVQKVTCDSQFDPVRNDHRYHSPIYLIL